MTLVPGTKLGPYEIQSLLGAGGMGEVYRAQDERLGREVALKVLASAVWGDAERQRRFELEARTTAALNHPNVVVIYEIGNYAGMTCLATELLEGKTLRNELAKGALRIGKAIGWGIQIARGLAAAHDRGIIHRDLKPENVFITSDGSAKILDFGLAKHVKQAASGSAPAGADLSEALTVETIPGTLLGTVGYMSPEQVRGEEVDCRSDIFSLGVLLYEMLSGVRPFDGGSAVEILHAILREEPEELTIKNPEVSPALSKVVRRTLAKDLRERFHSSKDVAFALEAIAPDAHAAGARVRLPESDTGTVARGFALTERVCKQLNRKALDPRIIGDHLEYMDNGVESDALLCYLHGTGLDANDFSELLADARCRAVAPTLYGFERHAKRRISLPIADHLIILQEWLRHLVERDNIKAIILIGFSTGGDLWQEFACRGKAELRLPLTGLIALDPNVSLQTCWVTRILSQLCTGTPAQVVEKLQTLSAGTRSLNEWLNVHEYLVRLLEKFQGSMDVLTKFATEIVQPFEGAGLGLFAKRFRCATSAIPYVRHIFSGAGVSNPEAEEIARVKLANLDTGFLGEAYSEDSIVVEYDADHFELLDPQRLRKYTDPLLQSVTIPHRKPD